MFALWGSSRTEKITISIYADLQSQMFSSAEVLQVHHQVAAAAESVNFYRPSQIWLAR